MKKVFMSVAVVAMMAAAVACGNKKAQEVTEEACCEAVEAVDSVVAAVEEAVDTVVAAVEEAAQ